MIGNYNNSDVICHVYNILHNSLHVLRHRSEKSIFKTCKIVKCYESVILVIGSYLIHVKLNQTITVTIQNKGYETKVLCMILRYFHGTYFVLQFIIIRNTRSRRWRRSQPNFILCRSKLSMFGQRMWRKFLQFIIMAFVWKPAGNILTSKKRVLICVKGHVCVLTRKVNYVFWFETGIT